jgi:hypothetical protein
VNRSESKSETVAAKIAAKKEANKDMRLAVAFAAGWRVVTRYTGTLFAVFAAQTLLALVCLFAVGQVLASVFAHRPMFDDGVAGDLVSLLWAWQYGKTAVFASMWLVIGVVLIWIIAGWFLSGGVAGVILQQPEGRASTAKQFGAAGANTFLRFGVLSILTAVFVVGIVVVFATCATWASAMLDQALTPAQTIPPLLLAFGPALILLIILWTVVDYARLELCLRRDSHELGASAAFFRAVAYVFRNPVTLLWSAAGWLSWGAVGVAYTYLMAGSHSNSAWSLFMIRLGVSLLRMTIRFATLGGHAHFSLQRPAPPAPLDQTLIQS